MGESIKNLDKITNKELLIQYSEIPWKHVMGVLDIMTMNETGGKITLVLHLENFMC